MKLPHVHHKRAKGRDYYYYDTGARVAGRPVLKRLPNPKDPAFAREYQAAQSARVKRGTVEDARNFEWLVRTYEKSPEFRALAENSKINYSRHLGYAAAAYRAGDGRSWPLAIITATHVLELRDKLADRPGAANATVRALKALYAWAAKPGRGYVTGNITQGIDLFDSNEHRPWPSWLVEEALNDPQVRLPVALLYFLGQRIGDTVRMGPRSINRGLVSVVQQKTGTPLRIAIHSRLARIIETDAPKDAMLFLVNEHGKPLTESGLRQRLQKWAKARGAHVVPHGLRRNAVNALLEAECSTAEVSAITGQSLAMVEHYAKERDREHLSRSAVLKFERRNKAG